MASVDQHGSGEFAVSRDAARAGLKAQQRRFGLLLLLPAGLAFCLIILWPFVQSLVLSLYEYTIMTPEPIWTGVSNFVTVFTTPQIIGSFFTTVIYVVATTFFTMVLGLGWALLMNQPFPGRGAIRSISLIPWLLPSTVTAFIWGWVLNSRYGILNAALLEVGLIDRSQAWLSTDSGAMVAIVITKVWLSIPLFMAFFLAGLQSIDQDQLGAARVDGANNWAIFRDHILPHLRPVILVIMVIGMIGNLQQFDTIFALTGGGPVRATSTLSIEVYRQAFESWDIGVASALGVLWVATIVPLAFFYLRALMRGT